jgi:hypothetical protein
LVLLADSGGLLVGALRLNKAPERLAGGSLPLGERLASSFALLAFAAAGGGEGIGEAAEGAGVLKLARSLANIL